MGTKPLWQMTEEELRSGELARSDQGGGCDRCADLPARLWEDAGLPPRGPLGGATLGNLDWTVLSPAVVKAVQDYACRLESYLAQGVGLVLVGSVGTGKTHIAVGVAKIALGLGIEAIFLTTDDLLGRIKRTYDGAGSEQEVMDELAEVPLLVLDDLGVEIPTDWARNCIHALINRRWMARKPLLAATNLTPDELEGRLGMPAMSRLWHNCITVQLNGPDYRAQQLSARLAAVRGSQ